MTLVISKGITLAKGFTWNETVWNPSMITTALWLDAADASTITESSGAVSQWNDKSGNSRHFTQASSAARPSIDATGARNVLSFDGDDFLIGSTDPILFSESARKFLVCYVGNGSTGTFISQNINSTLASRQFQMLCSGGAADNFGSILRGSSSDRVQFKTVNRSIHLFYWDGSAGIERVNGTQFSFTVGTAALETNAIIKIGARSNGTTTSEAFFLNGKIAETVARDSDTTLSDIQRIEGYLAHKWGLEANLPNDHPYKTVGPTP
jgi:hypothetical protein